MQYIRRCRGIRLQMVLTFFFSCANSHREGGSISRLSHLNASGLVDLCSRNVSSHISSMALPVVRLRPLVVATGQSAGCHQDNKEYGSHFEQHFSGHLEKVWSTDEVHSFYTLLDAGATTTTTPAKINIKYVVMSLITIIILLVIHDLVTSNLEGWVSSCSTCTVCQDNFHGICGHGLVILIDFPDWIQPCKEIVIFTQLFTPPVTLYSLNLPWFWAIF